MSLYLGNNLISGSKPINLGVRNIGEIVPSAIPLTDAGLHLLDGSLIQGGGIYQGFVDYIADLYAENPDANYFTTEALWQQSVTTYGACGKFVYDDVNNAVRLPKVTGKIDGTTDINALGDLEPLFVRLPNITGYVEKILSNTASSGVASGGFTKTRTSYGGNYNGSGDGSENTINFNASRSSSVYSGNGSDTTIHEQAIKMFFYIVIANSTKTDIQVDIDEIATDLNGKADVDLTNVNDAGNIKMAGASMPSDTYTNLTLGASGTQYTAPADGWFYIDKSGNNGTYVGFVNFGINNTYKYATTIPIYNTNGVALLPVKKNDKITVNYNAAGTTNVFRFIYAQGSESEAS